MTVHDRHGGYSLGPQGLGYVRWKYGVPARRGLRVIHEQRDHGVIVGGAGAHVRVRFGGEKHTARCHPLSLDYGDGVAPADRLAAHNAAIEAWNARLGSAA